MASIQSFYESLFCSVYTMQCKEKVSSQRYIPQFISHPLDPSFLCICSEKLEFCIHFYKLVFIVFLFFPCYEKEVSIYLGHKARFMETHSFYSLKIWIQSTECVIRRQIFRTTRAGRKEMRESLLKLLFITSISIMWIIWCSCLSF